MEEKGKSRVCVTGGAGYIGSWLVKKLLDRGYIVHATLRDIGDEKKARVLRGLPGATERLAMFQADLYDAATFAPAIQGCEYVFLVATPFQHNTGCSKYKNTTEAVIDAVRVILQQCSESKTVKRLIHTASISTASPLKEDSSGFKDFINESCWTSLNVNYALRSAHFDTYISSKAQSEKELLSYNDGEHPKFEVVTLACGVVAGDTILSHVPETLEFIVSPVSRNEPSFGFLRLMQVLLGSVPVAHVDDICDALVFCMERPSISGRFLCSAAYPTIQEVVDHYVNKYPQLEPLKEVEARARVRPNTNKLGDLGFSYKYGLEEILDGSVECAIRLGSLDLSKLSKQYG